MNKDRLIRLAALLLRNATNKKGVKFDLQDWGSSTDGHKKLDCGTTACAVGLACISGEFEKDGLTINMDLAIENNVINPRYKENWGWSAVIDFFSIDSPTAEKLFMSSKYPQGQRKGAAGEIAVANRILETVMNAP